MSKSMKSPVWLDAIARRIQSRDAERREKGHTTVLASTVPLVQIQEASQQPHCHTCCKLHRPPKPCLPRTRASPGGAGARPGAACHCAPGATAKAEFNRWVQDSWGGAPRLSRPGLGSCQRDRGRRTASGKGAAASQNPVPDVLVPKYRTEPQDKQDLHMGCERGRHSNWGNSWDNNWHSTWCQGHEGQQ